MDGQKTDCQKLVGSSKAMNMKDKEAWYHCGHCGSLFESDYGFDEERICEVCSRKPGVGLWPVVSSITPDASAKVASFHKTGDKIKKLARTPSTKRRRARRIFIFTLVWVLLLLGAASARYFLIKEQAKPRVLTLVDLDRNLTEVDRLKILNQVFPECERMMRGFLSATTTNDQSQFIARSLALKTLLETHENDHPLPVSDALQCTDKEWIRVGDEWMVLSHWKDTQGGDEFDAVFRKEFDGWRLDWPHFRRYSEVSWKLFLSGEGKLDQAEFRLLARKDQESNKPNLKGQRMMIVLAAPEWGKPTQVVDESPTISIDMMSDEGRLLKAAFDLREKDLAAGGGELAPLDPENFIRVRVVVTRDELAGEFRLILNKLKACHWMDSDISGF